MPGFGELIVTYGPSGGLFIFFGWNFWQWWIGRQGNTPRVQNEFAKTSDVAALTRAIGELNDELSEFTKEVRAAMMAHGERIARAETRLEERKR